MRKIFYLPLFLLFFSCNAQQKPMDTKQHRYTNHLIHETSPYLLQHAHNPVDWYPWGKEAFEKARRENKLVLVSIGYAACHWCHVMEKESFENEDVAGFMNDHFVCIKVDREQRPDVDHQYMDAVQLLTGRGGWPLNCFALPDGRPVWGGTYFPPKQWMSVLDHLNRLWQNEPQKLKEQAGQLARGIRQNNLLRLSATGRPFKKSDLDKALTSWRRHFDLTWGGSSGAPKFPMPSNYRFLLNQYYHNGDKSLLHYVELSLEKMAQGGIDDHLGGGFARYSTDSRWEVPHFEKMLYDNAQLLSLYAEAYRLTRKPLYKQVVYQTAGFLQRELLSPDGGFYASLDADSEGGEGNFYVWTKKETDSLLGEEAPLFNAAYSVTAAGNWETGKNVLFVQKDLKTLAGNFHLTPQEAEKRLASCRRKLFEARSRRTRPATDTKVLTSWNALTITGLLSAYGAFGDSL
ncbi:MAG TPA: thioredoxin domain-containing protein, partial [Bacteroidetes bacterium]|nr:thioredoxin domain-containing protein [Bacteroidota bacterium]